MVKRPAKIFSKKIKTPIKVIEIEPFVEEVHPEGFVAELIGKPRLPSPEKEAWERRKIHREAWDLLAQKLEKLAALREHYGIVVGDKPAAVWSIGLCLALA